MTSSDEERRAAESEPSPTPPPGESPAPRLVVDEFRLESSDAGVENRDATITRVPATLHEAGGPNAPRPVEAGWARGLTPAALAPVIESHGLRLGDELGRGAQGVVYRAKPLRGGPDVAVKVLRPEATEAEVVRFERAIDATSLLAGIEGIVHVLERGRVFAGSPFFTMELVEGRSLRALLEDGSVSPVSLALLVAQVAFTVHDAHDRGIVHRDLKPENVLVEESASGVKAKIADFGLARDVYEAGASLVGGGTPSYMAPEQITAAPITRRTDVYALGAVLYEVIAGAPPLRRPSLGALLRAIVEERPRAPAVFWSGLPDALAGVALRALEKDPDARHPTAAAFGNEVLRALRGETVGGIPIRPRATGRGRLARFVGRVRDGVVRQRVFLLGFGVGIASGLAMGLLFARR
jgi:serine/threonine protein kinase